MHRLAFVFIFAIITCGGCADKFSSEDPEEQKIIEMVKLLREPRFENDEQNKKADEAYDNLMAMGTKSLPVLVMMSKDKSVANSMFQLPTIEATTTGYVCELIIQNMLIDSLIKGVYSPMYFWSNDIDEWWGRSKGKSLLELKIEMLEWYVTTPKAKSYPAYRRRALPLLNKRLEEYKKQAGR
ncbi:MAG: hypothetical protein JXR97_01650 [Planctomycetes bacterium]|nr:hypothetical protein [Planctomycetota bacterium]